MTPPVPPLLSCCPPGVEMFTETTEFVRSVAVSVPSGGGGGPGGVSSSFMDVDEPVPQEKKTQQQQRRKFRKGGWVAVDEGEGEVRGKGEKGGGGSRGNVGRDEAEEWIWSAALPCRLWQGYRVLACGSVCSAAK